MADFQTTVELKAKTGQMTQKLNQTERQLKQVSAQVRKTQGAFTRMGRKVSGTFNKMNRKIKEHRTAIAGIGLSLGLLVAKGVKDFKEWEDGLAQIATLGVTGIKGISDELDAVRREFGITGAEATKGYYDIISAGAKQGAEAMGQLTAATKLAKAGNTDLAAAIDVVTSGINIFGDNGETATSIVDQLFLAVKFGKTTVEELGKTFGYVAPVIDAAGLSMADYAASMATVTAGGIATKQATTGLKAVLSNLIKVTPKAAKKAKELGLDFGVSALKAKGLVGVMQDIADATQGDVTELGYLFDSIEAINAVAVLTSNTGLASLERNFNAMSDSAGTTEEALAKVKETASYNFGKFNQGLSIMSRSIGASVIPSLLSMADALAPIVDFMSALITQHPGIIKVTLAVTALGIALAFLGGPITLAIVATGIAIKKLSDHFDLFADGGVAALEKIELVWDNFWAGFADKDLRETLNYIFSGVGDWVSDLLPKGGFADLWTNTKVKLTEFWTSLSGWFTKQDWAGIWSDTLEFAGDIWSGVKTALTLAWVNISLWFQTTDWDSLWTGTLEFIGDIWGGVKTALNTMWTSLVDWFTTTDWKGLWTGNSGNPHADGGVLGFIGDIWSGVKSALTTMWTSLTAWFTSVDWAGLWDGTLNFAGDVWSGISTGLTAMWSSLTTWFDGKDWAGLWTDTLNFAGDVWAGVKTSVTSMWTSLTNWFDTQDWTGLWAGTLSFVGNVWTGVKSSLTTMWSSLTIWFSIQDWDGLWLDTLAFVGDIWAGVKSGLSTMWTSLTDWFIIQDWDGLWSGTLDFVGDVWSGVKTGLTAMWTSLTNWFSIQDWDGLWDGILNFVGDVWTGIKATLDIMWTSLSNWFTTADWKGLWAGTLEFTGDIWSSIKNHLVAAWVGIDLWFQTADWSTLWDNTLEFAGDIWSGVKTALTAVWDGISGWFSGIDWAGLWYGVGPHGGGLLEFTGDIWQGIKDALSAAWTGITEWFANADWAGLWEGTLIFTGKIWDGIKVVLDAMWTGVSNWFTTTDWDSLWKGTLEFTGKVWDGIKVVLDAAWTGITNWFDTTNWSSVWDNTLEFTGKVWDGIKIVLDAAWTSITSWFATADWKGLWTGTLAFAGDVWSGIKVVLDTMWTSVTNWFTTADWAGLWAGTLSFAGDVWTGIKVVLDAAWTSITSWFSTTDWSSLWAGTLGFAGDIWSGIKVTLDAMWTSIANWFTTTDWSSLWNNTLEFTGDVWSGLKTGLDASWVKIEAWFSGLDWTGVGESVRAGMKGALTGIGDIFAGVLGEEETIGGDRLGAAAVGITAGGKIVSKLWPILQKQFAVLSARIAAYLGPLGAGVMSGPVGWILLGAVAVGGLTYAFWPQIKSFFTDMWDSVTEWFGDLDWSGMWDGLLDSLKNIGSNVVDIVKGWFSNININPLSWFGSSDNASVTDDGGEGRGSIAPLNKAAGGFISGSGTGTSDSIPAMLSDGEFVINAKSTKLFGPLLEALNSQKFAKGGRVGAMRQVQKFAAGGSVSDAKSYQFLQFEEGLFSMSATIDKFIGNMDATDPAVNKVVRQLEYLQKHTSNLNEDQVLAHDYATRVNQAMIELLPNIKEEAEVASDAAGAVKDLGDAAKKSADTIVKETNEWEGTAQSFTGPIKQALANGGDIGEAFKSGVRGLMSRITSKLLDKAFAPLEAGIDSFINNLMSSNSGGGGFLGGLFGGGGGGGGGGSDIGRVVSSLFGGMMMSRGGIVPRNGMRPQYFANGGMAKGTDTVPAMLTPGEMVLTKEQQQMMMGGQQKAGDTYNFNIEATDANSFKRMLSQDPKFLANIAEQGKAATSGLRRAR